MKRKKTHSDENSIKISEQVIKKCEALLILGDDYGDNPITFRCQLKEGHRGMHVEINDFFEFVIVWNGDSRVKCEFCGKLIHPNYYNWCVVDDCSEDIYICPECSEKIPKNQQNMCKKHRGAKNGKA